MTLRGVFIPERNIALFLDVDGTLLEIAATPDAVKVPAALRNTLRLAATREHGALALVSGRSIEELDRLFAPQMFVAAGLHGLERRDAGGNFTRPTIDPEKLSMPRETLAQLQKKHEGLLFEDKGITLALHYRRAPRLEPLVKQVMNTLVARLHDQFLLRAGKYVVELAPCGYSKRTAIEAFMVETPFVNRLPVFIGDDVTDEDGFEAVNAMGGCSIRVGNSTATSARYTFGSVSAVIAWLRERNLNLHLSGRRR